MPYDVEKAKQVQKAFGADESKADAPTYRAAKPEAQDPNRMQKLREAAEASSQKWMKDNNVDANGDPLPKPSPSPEMGAMKRRLENQKK